VNLFGIFQSRGSGFDYLYSPSTNPKYSNSYFDGIKPTRSNYVAGLSIAWNITSIAKIKQQVKAQQFLTAAYKNEYDQVTTQLQDQSILADQRIDNSLQSAREVPLQYQAASEAFLQKTVLYKNGLTNIVDLQQAQFALNRAQTDRDVANINVWQSLLLKAAASGDFDLFIRQVK
jgi:outer membrane protein TolC